MVGFTRDDLAKKFADMNGTQQCIQTLSLWLIHHRKHYRDIVHAWFQALLEAKDNRKLTFMYLANDVIQNSKKKGPEFGDAFGIVLRDAFASLRITEYSEKTRTNIQRILNIWEERGVYNPVLIQEFKDALVENLLPLQRKRGRYPDLDADVDVGGQQSTHLENYGGKRICLEDDSVKSIHSEDYSPRSVSLEDDGSKPTSSKDAGSASVNPEDAGSKSVSPEYSSPKLCHSRSDSLEYISLRDDSLVSSYGTSRTSGCSPDTEELIKSLLALEHSASGDEAVRVKLAALPIEVTEMHRLKRLKDIDEAEALSVKVNEAVQMISEYNSRLSKEMIERKKVSSMLKRFMWRQKRLLDEAKDKLNEYGEKLEKVYAVRREVKLHLQNFPDPMQVIGAMAPLPALKDLFGKK